MDAPLYSIGLEIEGPAGRFGLLMDADGPLSLDEALAWVAQVQAEHPDYEVTLLAEVAP